MKRHDLLDLDEALQHPGRKIAVDLSTEFPEEADLDLVTPLEGFLEAKSTGNMLLIHGEFKVRCVCECARCGSPIEQDVDFTMDEEFDVEGVPTIFAADDYAKVVDDEGGELFEENNLKVEALLRQGLLLNLPVQPLCEYGWEGPCPNAKNAKKQQPEHEKTGLERLGELIHPEGSE